MNNRDEEIKLVAEILSRVAPRFWIVLENEEGFVIAGDNPWALKTKLDATLTTESLPFRVWRDSFSTPEFDDY